MKETLTQRLIKNAEEMDFSGSFVSYIGNVRYECRYVSPDGKPTIGANATHLHYVNIVCGGGCCSKIAK